MRTKSAVRKRVDYAVEAFHLWENNEMEDKELDVLLRALYENEHVIHTDRDALESFMMMIDVKYAEQE